MEQSNYTSVTQIEESAAVGLRLRQIRLNAHMTQEKLADQLSVTVNYLGEVERGRKPLSLNLARRICRLLDVTYDYLYQGRPPESIALVREDSSYESIHTSLNTRLDQCTMEELIVVNRLVNCYLDTSRHLQSQKIPDDHTY